MTSNYVDLKKNTNGTPYSLKNNNMSKRDSAYQIENEFEEVTVQNNINSIQRATGPNFKNFSLNLKPAVLSSIVKNLNENKFNNMDTINYVQDSRSTVDNLMNNNFYNLIPLVKKDNPSKYLNNQEVNGVVTNLNNINSVINHNSNESHAQQVHIDHNLNFSPIKKSSMMSVNSSQGNLSIQGITKFGFKNYYNPQINQANSEQRKTSQQYSHMRSMTPPSQKSNKSNDVFLKPPMKRGLFSQPKFAVFSSVLKPAFKSQPKLAINHQHRYSFTNENNNVGQNIQSNPTNFTDKYQVNYIKPRSIINLNTMNNRSLNLADDVNDSYLNLNLNNTSLKKNDSSSSFNFNKYKVGAGLNMSGINNPNAVSNDNISANLLAQSTDILWNQKNANLKNENNVNNENKGQATYQTFSNNEIGVLSNKQNFNIMQQSANRFKTRPNYENESRRMLIEMVKLKLRQDNSSNLYGLLSEMKLNPNILNKQMSNNINNNVSKSTPSPTSSISTIQLNDNKTNNTKRQMTYSISKGDSSNLIEDKYNQLTNAVEIKNNNFEINNNYYGNISVPADNTLQSNLQSNKSNVPQFIYNMDEDSTEKINLICYLATPRLLFMNIGSTKVPFLFQLSPSSLCHVYGVEHYLLQWNDFNSMALVGTIDMLKILSCSIKSGSNESTLLIETAIDRSINIKPSNTTNFILENNKYEIISNNSDECKLYVNALNYLSQLVKCKAYAFKGKNNK